MEAWSVKDAKTYPLSGGRDLQFEQEHPLFGIRACSNVFSGAGYDLQGERFDPQLKRLTDPVLKNGTAAIIIIKMICLLGMMSLIHFHIHILNIVQQRKSFHVLNKRSVMCITCHMS